MNYGAAYSWTQGTNSLTVIQRSTEKAILQRIIRMWNYRKQWQLYFEEIRRNHHSRYFRHTLRPTKKYFKYFLWRLLVRRRGGLSGARRTVWSGIKYPDHLRPWRIWNCKNNCQWDTTHCGSVTLQGHFVDPNNSSVPALLWQPTAEPSQSQAVIVFTVGPDTYAASGDTYLWKKSQLSPSTSYFTVTASALSGYDIYYTLCSTKNNAANCQDPNNLLI